jgi:hypothetical protein
MVVVSKPVPVFPPSQPITKAEAIAAAPDLVCSVLKLPPITASTPKAPCGLQYF